MFNNTYYNISENIKINIIDIEELDKNLIDLLDSFFVQICEGDSGTELDLVKKDFKSYLDSKKGTDLEKGSIAELFIHLFLNSNGFKQECLFENLEENSIKKGFDGYYSCNNQEWIMESKSGTISSQNISHENKICKAYNDLKGKVSTEQKNNPWKNAYNHARVVKTKKSIISNIKKFSDDYRKGIFYDISDFNIIPSSTIFLEGNWSDVDKNELKERLLKKINNFNFKNLIVICVTKESIGLIYNYLSKNG